MSYCSRFARFAALVIVVALLAAATNAVPPHPRAIEEWKAQGILDQKLANLRALDAPNRMTSEQILQALDRSLASQAALGGDAGEVDTVRVCVLLVDFVDFHYDDTYYAPGDLTANGVIEPYQFDSLMFSRQGVDPLYNPTGSMTEFYLENSYGKYFIVGDVWGWFTLSNPYSYYVGDDDGNSRGRTLVEHAVYAADPNVDFSVYANGGYNLPGLIVVHAGPGAEQGAYGIWSHRSSASADADGVHIGSYTLNPEEDFYTGRISNVGVFCHEWGHVLGLPDWYDVNYNEGSEGLGSWDVMASGSWNDDGRRPAHFSGWSKATINPPNNFIDPIILTENLPNAPIPMVEAEPFCYILMDQYDTVYATGDRWIIENRQRYSFDEALPGSGLLIYHFDPTQLAGNTVPGHYRLAVEQADGLDQLGFSGSEGDAGDPFPGSTNNRNFHDYSTPNSRAYSGALTQVGVWDISNSDSLMYADLDVTYSRPWLVPGDEPLTMFDYPPYGIGDGDGIWEQGETIGVVVEFVNMMRLSFLPFVHMTCSNPEIQMVSDDESMGTALNFHFTAENLSPLKFRIPDDFRSSRTTFTFTVRSVDDYANPQETYETTKSYQVTLGKPQILLVDDDDGRTDESDYMDALDRLGLPFDRWDKDADFSPTYTDLARYENVFWMTGSYFPPTVSGGELNADDIAALMQYLDNGGNLLLGSYSAASKLDVADSAFMADYLHSYLAGSYPSWRMKGETGSTVGNAYRYITESQVFTEMVDLIEPINGGVPEFMVGTTGPGHCGISYDGNHRTLFLTMNVEFFQDAAINNMPKDTLIMRTLDFFFRGSATAVDDDPSDLLPNGFALDQNYPNPFNPTTTISYSLGAGQTMTNLSVFNVLGQKVTTLVNEVQGPGTYTVNWAGTSAAGAPVASGIYFYRLTRGEDIETKKMMLVK